MMQTNVPSSTTEDALQVLAEALETLAPEPRKAGCYILENPNEVSVSSVRELAEAADVKPNTLVRMARSIGFEGYEDFREPFREAVRRGQVSFPDRARWLQAAREEGRLGELYADMVSATLDNLETTFAGIDAEQLKAAGEAIWASRNTFTLGVGVHTSNAQNFTYLASTGMLQFSAIPKTGSTAIDDLAWADERDVLIAITCKPFRREVVEAVRVAKEQGMTVIGISDSAASPVITEADHGFVVGVETPQFFPSSVAIIGLLETLLSFVIAAASPNIVDRVRQFHRRRHELGLYEQDVSQT